MHSCQEKEERHGCKTIAGTEPSDFQGILRGKKMHTFSPTIAIVISMN